MSTGSSRPTGRDMSAHTTTYAPQPVRPPTRREIREHLDQSEDLYEREQLDCITEEQLDPDRWVPTLSFVHTTTGEYWQMREDIVREQAAIHRAARLNEWRRAQRAARELEAAKSLSAAEKVRRYNAEMAAYAAASLRTTASRPLEYVSYETLFEEERGAVGNVGAYPGDRLARSARTSQIPISVPRARERVAQRQAATLSTVAEETEGEECARQRVGRGLGRESVPSCPPPTSRPAPVSSQVGRTSHEPVPAQDQQSNDVGSDEVSPPHANVSLQDPFTSGSWACVGASRRPDIKRRSAPEGRQRIYGVSSSAQAPNLTAESASPRAAPVVPPRDPHADQGIALPMSIQTVYGVITIGADGTIDRAVSQKYAESDLDDDGGNTSSVEGCSSSADGDEDDEDKEGADESVDEEQEEQDDDDDDDDEGAESSEDEESAESNADSALGALQPVTKTQTTVRVLVNDTDPGYETDVDSAAPSPPSPSLQSVSSQDTATDSDLSYEVLDRRECEPCKCEEMTALQQRVKELEEEKRVMQGKYVMMLEKVQEANVMLSLVEMENEKLKKGMGEWKEIVRGRIKEVAMRDLKR